MYNIQMKNGIDEKKNETKRNQDNSQRKPQMNMYH